MTQAKSSITQIISRLGLVLVVVLFGIIMTFLSPVFLSFANFQNLLIQSTVLAILALGQTFVIMTKGIDLSVGGIMAVSAAVGLGLSVDGGVPVVLGIAIAIAIGALAGLLNGFAVTRLGITPLIVTLAMLGMTRGAVFVYTNGANVTPIPDILTAFGRGRFLNLPTSVWLLLILAVVAHLVLARTTFGRSVYATGGNEVAARVAGIPTARIITLCYVISGIMAAIAGLVLTARLESAGPRAGAGIELTVIAACVIGGTSLFGGQGSIAGTLLGVVLISLVSNAVNLLGVPPAWDELVRGLVIFFAALVDVYRRKLVIGRVAGGT